MSKFYYRDGSLAVDMSLPNCKEKMSTLEEKLSDPKYKVVKQDVLKNGLYVSTVWVGIDYSLVGGEPLIFETMVFPNKGDWLDLDMERYSTEKEALAGHREMVKKWSKYTDKSET